MSCSRCFKPSVVPTRAISCAASSAAIATSQEYRPTSDVETFAAVRLYIDSWRWEGVPFLIRAGKCLPVTATEALVKFRRPPIGRVRHADRNYIRFRLGPDLAIAIGARVKGSGETLSTTPVELLAVGQQRGDEISAYERLIADAMNGDPLLFARADGVETMWAVADPLVMRQRVSSNTSPVRGGQRRPTRWRRRSAAGRTLARRGHPD